MANRKRVARQLLSLQLDVFHALCDLYHPSIRILPTVRRNNPTDEERRRGTRHVPYRNRGKEYCGRRDRRGVGNSKVYEYLDPHGRVIYPNGSWLEFNSREMRNRVIQKKKT